MRYHTLGAPGTPVRDNIPVSEYIHGTFVPLSKLPHNWEMHSAAPLSPAEDRTMVREPAQAVPASIAERLGKVRVLVVPWIACLESGDEVSFAKPKGETHSAVWIETSERIHLVLPCKELARYSALLEDELRAGVAGEIDEDSRGAKQPLIGRRARRKRSPELSEHYRDISFVSTTAEYMHGLWHDVQIRLGPEHLPVAQLRRRMALLGEMFPPNEGYAVFAEGLEKEE